MKFGKELLGISLLLIELAHLHRHELLQTHDRMILMVDVHTQRTRQAILLAIQTHHLQELFWMHHATVVGIFLHPIIINNIRRR